MALTAYCKKCDREVPAGDMCPRCGTRLGKTSAHAVWCLERTPVRDWMCWNAVMRVLLPAGLAVLLLVLLLEGLSGGIAAVEAMLASGLLPVLAMLLGTAILLVGLFLLLQGRELADYTIDNRGVHETVYLPDPTPLKLLARLRSPALLREADTSGSVTVLRLSRKDLAWRDVARIQLWPESCRVLVYAPSRWLRVAVTCTPFTWDDTMALIRNKLGRKKKVLLPPSLVVAAPPARRAARSQVRIVPEVEEAIEQLRMEEAPAFPEPEADATPSVPDDFAEETGQEQGGAP